MTRVALAGITGWVGRPLAEAIEAAKDLSLVSAVSRSAAGTTLHGVVVRRTAAEALDAKPDVFVDYTTASAVKEHVLIAIDRGIHVVIGSSGLSDDDYREIDAAARKRTVGVVAVGNFAIASILMQRFALEAARSMPSWEIIDYAGAGKPDAPSGTARQLASLLAHVHPPEVALPIAETIGPVESRGATFGGTQIHSLRLPTFAVSLEIIFGAPDQRLTIRYDAGEGPQPYIPGTLAAIRRAPTIVGVDRSVEWLLT